jgi:hypothetical protein
MVCCTKCGLDKPPSAFSPGKRSDGLQSRCKRCFADARAVVRRERPEHVRAQTEASRARHPDAWKIRYEKNKEAEKQRKAEYYKANKDLIRARIKGYDRAHPHVRTAITAKRRAKLLRATPPWACADGIKRVYETAARLTRETGVEHEVDHIIPLQGRLVSGLHCEANLQAIPKTENRKKGARAPA